MRLQGVTGAEATITVEGETTAIEYRDPDTPDTPKRMTRYIEATAGLIFSIEIAYKANFKYKDYDIKQQVWIDGKLVNDRLLRTKNLEGGTTSTVERPNRGPRGNSRNMFRWKALLVTDEAPANLNDEQKLALELVGLISVQLFRKERVEAGEVVPVDIEVPESKLKGRGIYIGVDTGEATPYMRHEWLLLDSPERPCAEFKFQYRSALALRELRILPTDWGSKRRDRKAGVDHGELGRPDETVKGEEGLDSDPEKDNDYCVIDEERSKFVPRKRTWIDLCPDDMPTVHDSDPGWSEDIPIPKKKRPGAGGGIAKVKGEQNKHKAKCQPTENNIQNDAHDGSAIPMMSGGRDGRPNNSHAGEERSSVVAEDEGDPHTGSDIFAANESCDESSDAQMTGDSDDDEDTDTLNLSHERASESHADAYRPGSAHVGE